jgi:ArsR family transcriptional regulator
MKIRRTSPSTKGCLPQQTNKQSPDLRPVEGPKANAELARFAKALGHPARVMILRVLARKTACTCSLIVDELPLAQSTVSEHLRILKHAGLIRGEVDGPRISYCIEPVALRRFRALVGSL